MASRNFKLTLTCETCGAGFHPRFDSPGQKYCSRPCIQWDARPNVQRKNSIDDVRNKILARTTKAYGCWIWQGSKSGDGYGHIALNGKVERTHRASYIAFKGPIPGGMFVCHACDTPSCVNPEHLWLGTSADNTADKMRKGRHRSRPGKLSPLAIDEIRRNTTARGVDLARKFGVTASAISQVRSGKRRNGDS